ncbi:hypothetical protein M758_1G005000 [Ceratodon purpureus]|uniref:Uncharacterized protein n=1 Tax=Ceratodon purpureus TaxID=3225 RepID=A0A8T0J2Y6_CERPU|nr:hypothetical protein KC19_1G006200 [Ceratodon purpureus]KAG0628149.1 hypothetical protein M758_1G005000 [Ceratodon purpureus]
MDRNMQVLLLSLQKSRCPSYLRGSASVFSLLVNAKCIGALNKLKLKMKDMTGPRFLLLACPRTASTLISLNARAQKSSISISKVLFQIQLEYPNTYNLISERPV